MTGLGRALTMWQGYPSRAVTLPGSAAAMAPTTSAMTFLFTDIEGSTRLWETEQARMADALARHDALCRREVEAHGGRVVKMIGDGLHAVFADPAAAVASTLGLQRGMAAIGEACGIPFKMRCGLHAGVSQIRDGDYFGGTVNRAARIAGAAHGGQILVSQSVIDLGRDRFAPGIEFVHLGRVRLRDLSTPEDLWQLVSDELQRTFPALRSLDSTPNNLPQQLTSFIGREKEIAEMKSLLGKTRLLTLTGSGGCGKTRLSLQVAAELIDAYADGVWLVELAGLADPDLVPQALATVLGLKEERGVSLMETIVVHLKSRRLLLLLDNAEHLLTACAQLVDTVLRQCRHVALLASSREGLGTAGELTYRVPSLSMPDPRRDAEPDALLQFESVRLFVERARAHHPQFAVNSQNAAALASICSRLDGIPLALELAAARVRALSVDEVNQRLDQRFRLLTGGSRTALPRQQTLRSLIDWSYDLLRDEERALLSRLAVFAGGWTLAAAERVCSDEIMEEGAVLDFLTSLVDKSLVAAEERDGAMRYRLLETVRQYARDRLLERGDGSAWRDRHLAFYLSFGEEAETMLSGPQQQLWLRRVETEYDDLRAALAWSSAPAGDAQRGLQLAGAIWRYWYMRGLFGEGRGWLGALLANVPGGSSRARAKALNAAGTLAWQQADYAAAAAAYTEALAIWRELGDRHGESGTLSNMGNVAHGLGDYPGARARLEESLVIRRELGDRKGVADALNNLAVLAYDKVDYATARAQFEECLAIRREMGDRWNIAVVLTNLGAIADAEGDFAACRKLYEESLSIFRDLGDRWGMPGTLNNLGEMAYALGDYDEASARFAESLAIRREIGDRRGVAGQLNNLGRAKCAKGDFAGARDLHEESVRILCELGERKVFVEALEGLANVAAGSGDPVQAARFWGAAEQLRESLACPLPTKDLVGYEGRVAATRAQLGDDAAFARAWTQGRAMTLEEAQDFALPAREAQRAA